MIITPIIKYGGLTNIFSMIFFKDSELKNYSVKMLTISLYCLHKFKSLKKVS